MILALAVEIGSTFSSSSITIQLGQVASESINLEEKKTSHVYTHKNCKVILWRYYGDAQCYLLYPINSSQFLDTMPFQQNKIKICRQLTLRVP